MTSIAPRLSVVIPAYNEQATIADCLTSLAAQDYPGAVEVIVVDNASTDGTVDLARSHGASVVSEPARGVCRARQRGTMLATGDIVVSTDADTVFPPTWLSQIDATMRSRPDLVATCGPCSFVDGPWWGRLYTTTLFGVTAWIYRCSGRVVYATATNIAFRRSAWTGYDTSATQGGDELGLLRNLRAVGPVNFDNRRATSTSSRRLHRGLFYNAVVTCLFFYLFAYHVNRISGRQVVGSAPAIRLSGVERPQTPRKRATAWLALLVGILAMAWWLAPVDVV